MFSTMDTFFCHLTNITSTYAYYNLFLFFFFFFTALTDLFIHALVYLSVIYLLCLGDILTLAGFCDYSENETQPLTFRCSWSVEKHP